MTHEQKVAHHEAAHVAVSRALGGSAQPEGIDLNAESSVPGAYGRAMASVFPDNPTGTDIERREALFDSLVAICAGAASDAKIEGISLREALERQPGDKSEALKLLDSSPLIEKPEEKIALLDRALERAADYLNSPIVGKAVEEIAQATLKAGGRLDGAEIESIWTRVKDDGSKAETK
jgi:hypothetical protein